MEWISVNDKLPSKNGYYLCWNMKSKYGDKENWEFNIFYWEDNLWLAKAYTFSTRKPSYWMPLPPPPKEHYSEIV